MEHIFGRVGVWSPSAESASELLLGAPEKENHSAERLAKDDGDRDDARREKLKDQATRARVDIRMGFPREQQE
jgi:hypothetical protein